MFSEFSADFIQQLQYPCLFSTQHVDKIHNMGFVTIFRVLVFPLPTTSHILIPKHPNSTPIDTIRTNIRTAKHLNIRTATDSTYINRQECQFTQLSDTHHFTLLR